MWGTTWRQRLRLAPLYLALLAAERLPAAVPHRRAAEDAARPSGLTVVIPERDTPELLSGTLAALAAALARVDLPRQVIVVVNGAASGRYAELRQRHGDVVFLHSDQPLGFGGAIERGLEHATHDWTYLLNSDMRLDVDALATLLPWRADDVFAVGSQIFQTSADGRREETGFVDWYVDGSGIRAFHAPPRHDAAACPALCAGGGAALFRTDLLLRYVRAARCYDPFYWEDADWGVCAWREGLRVLFCPDSQAHHLHRATTSRFYAADELERIVERNRLLFDARHAASGDTPAELMARICALPYPSQRELASTAIAAAVLRQRRRAKRARAPLLPQRLLAREQRGIVLAGASYACRLRAATGDGPRRPCVLFVTPFAVYPPRHGGARRVAELLRCLRAAYDIVLISDEAGLYDARSLAPMDGLYAVHLVERGRVDRDDAPGLAAQMRAHCHRQLTAALAEAIDRYRPQLVQVEHFELAELVRQRQPGQRWVLGLHDAVRPEDFAAAGEADAFATGTLAAYDAVTVCSAEDAALTAHRRVVVVPNGSAVPLAGYRPSGSTGLLFVGPFRYAPNLDGLRRFLREAWPAIRSAHPDVTLTALGGDEATAIVAADPLLRQQGVTVLRHREDVPELLRAAALSINPLTGIRGSAVKLVESLSAGRVCVSTDDGARGFGGERFAALVTVADVGAMAAPIIALLADAARRHALEAPDERLAAWQWERCAERQRSLYDGLLQSQSDAP
ncbi:MAG: glycosyltransferase [Betaproteobacteria bacterium]|nr:glycosyltransferase [Betaproteobacteria bacterium]